MGPLRNYRLPDGTTRQYREGEQPSCAAVVEVAAKQTPESRAAAAKRRAKAKED